MTIKGGKVEALALEILCPFPRSSLHYHWQVESLKPSFSGHLRLVASPHHHAREGKIYDRIRNFLFGEKKLIIFIDAYLHFTLCTRSVLVIVKVECGKEGLCFI
jgi:hypothetical protein